ncbi:hypothetical protein PV328_012263 [Microctonus aethiopoides]|uniref:Saposin A-type domain-containing protein n=1 Tax=Microctonus aethiopoides TaxID=144406 RepID=A0AA39KPZ1_9HYME|nr:hypothetical protein PV328_012263 [Microctonus aethiopoides]
MKAIFFILFAVIAGITAMAITTEQTTIEPLLTEEITTETITEEPTTFETMPIVGDEYCTWGPSYWCHNKTTAAECDATTYCTNYVWSENTKGL